VDSPDGDRLGLNEGTLEGRRDGLEDGPLLGLLVSIKNIIYSCLSIFNVVVFSVVNACVIQQDNSSNNGTTLIIAKPYVKR
jgi:hypothetical protein